MPRGSHDFSRHPGGDRLRMAGAAGVAVLAVLAGILLVNLLNGSGDSDGAAPAVAGGPAAPSGGPTPGADRPEDSASPTPSERATPSRSPSPTPAPRPSPTPQSAPAQPPAPPGTGAPKVFAPVVVLNNSRIAGLADSAADRVEAAGFRVERVGNYLSQYNVPVSTVFYDPEDADAARTLLETVPGVGRMVPRAETRIIETDTLILVVTRDFPTDDQP
ncbi:LytR C-terminal domain-containing protein [Parafrankia discariae]|uniref:LytR C-terminal domain-containing protein n=1 Tax=Parafrankia discariae TaxID=365528 RepID=UPI000369C528|nr:LytR C-terminal domain-containing protein [Parafrankia discariae]